MNTLEITMAAIRANSSITKLLNAVATSEYGGIDDLRAALKDFADSANLLQDAMLTYTLTAEKLAEDMV